jgi:hypothetical protein
VNTSGTRKLHHYSYVFLTTSDLLIGYVPNKEISTAKVKRGNIGTVRKLRDEHMKLYVPYDYVHVPSM